ncbi:response regulator [Stieleria marina]|uniref:Response regulator MprA n=1 Tax=Stieleria marina TaxID=1930275 RepID=A0A517NZQ4_9BACT|nr:Response regulator MprA [Planctomycetes bacterium K23_9]
MTPRLLITDDDNAFRNVLCEGLQRRGFDVQQACDGEEAIEVLRQGEIHLALVDYQMPRATGLDVMQHVHTSSPHLPCVLLTAQLDDSLRQAAMNLNAYSVLSKPVKLMEISQVIADALRDAWGWNPTV